MPAGGDDPRAIAQGAKDTGYISQRTGIVTTSNGLLFQAGGDGKLRVYDSENGRVLWTGQMPAGSRGIPAMYEVERPAVLRRQRDLADCRAEDAASGQPSSDTIARAYVAYALPEKGSQK